MSVALALYYLSGRLGGVQALPLANIDRRTTSTCDDINNCRTTSDIVWSCLTTIFTCTWVAIHPNIPAPYESSFEIGLKRFGIVLMALIAPELVIMWAMRQWLVSRRLAREHEAQGWTQTHGFFALMGGFMLIDGDGKALYTLSPKKLDELAKEGKVKFPTITKREIEDKSKGDAISKGFVIIQTGWFVLQCIARGIEHLPIMELELVTLAFAVLNLATYTMWWNKPQNVDCPAQVYLMDAISRHSQDCVVGDVPGILERIRRTMRQQSEELDHCKGPRGLNMLLLPFINMGAPVIRDENRTDISFYAGETLFEADTAQLVSAAIAVGFGALHCIAWSFPFPSQEKKILWRTCSVAITCLPVYIIPLGLLAHYSNGLLVRRDDNFARVVAKKLCSGLWLVFLILAIIYIASRAILLIEAFILLKSLPLGAFRTVQWTNFIPHV
ncbi:hypothetical protein BD410DRAFT_845549 [Rickenella mellea]|uniref:Uncharacterized protein n=1 Tax=Rickenella mellea TaxID=50990 RepID=A0A4Y7PHP4_9AGAM|nr:hypothetical protein BD410DRAFT_845549 [Rickenella mellea]